MGAELEVRRGQGQDLNEFEREREVTAKMRDETERRKRVEREQKENKNVVSVEVGAAAGQGPRCEGVCVTGRGRNTDDAIALMGREFQSRQEPGRGGDEKYDGFEFAEP